MNIEKNTLKRFSPLECHDCLSREDLMCSPYDLDVILCKCCLQKRLEVIKEEERAGAEDEEQSWEEYVKEDHLNHWRKNA